MNPPKPEQYHVKIQYAPNVKLHFVDQNKTKLAFKI
jgi:hypothetical protein